MFVFYSLHAIVSEPVGLPNEVRNVARVLADLSIAGMPEWPNGIGLGVMRLYANDHEDTY